MQDRATHTLHFVWQVTKHVQTVCTLVQEVERETVGIRKNSYVLAYPCNDCLHGESQFSLNR